MQNVKESALTNIEIGSSTQTANINPAGSRNITYDLDNVIEPINNFLNGEEKNEKNKIGDNNKIKTIINDPNQKKVKDAQIKASNEKLRQITKLKYDLASKETELKNQQLQQQKQVQSVMKQPQNSQQQMNFIRQQISQGVREAYEGIITREFPHIEQMKEAVPPVNVSQPQALPTVNTAVPQMQQPKAVTYRVKFDPNTQDPWEAVFTQRGFKIGETRFSFEDVETALSKNYTITLDGGKGLVLDPIKMQKIMKYKNYRPA